MAVRTYNPLPVWPPAVLAAALLLARRPGLALCAGVAAHVVGPLIARVLHAVDPAHTDYPTTD